MSAKANYFRLGLFVIAALGLLVAGVFMLGAGEWFKETMPVETYFAESIQGLEVGTAVKFRGVSLGKVCTIDFANRKYEQARWSDDKKVAPYVLVEIALDISKFAPMTRQEALTRLERMAAHGLRFRMASSGLAGPAYLEAEFMDPQAYPALPLAWKPESLYIPSAPSTLTSIVTAIESMSAQLEKARIDKVIGNIDKLVLDVDKAVAELKVPELQEQMVALLKEVRASNDVLQKTISSPKINQAIDDLAATSASLKGLFQGGEKDLKATVADLPQISGNLKTSSKRLDELLADPKIDKMIDGLSKTADNAAPAVLEMRKVLRELGNLLSNQSQDIEAIIRGLRQVTENVEAISEDAKNNPSRLLFGDPPPRQNTGERK